MSIEKRLSDHMAEQADQLAFPATDPGDITGGRRPRPRRGLGSMAALVVIVGAGLGFWALTTDDGVGTTELTAGAVDDDDEASDGTDTGDGGDDAGTGDGEGGEAVAGIGPFVDLRVIDTTDDNSPGSGRVAVDDGVYYVLSTAPGRVRLDGNLSEEEWTRIFRQNTIYSLDGDGGWQANKVEDRFISSLEADQGLLYVVSTGTMDGGETVALGTSADRGQTWEWDELGGLPPVNQVATLRTGSSTIIVGSRWGSPTYEETLAAARGAGIDLVEEGLRRFDSEGFSYIPIDPEDRCSIVYLNYGLHEFADWARNAPEDERRYMEQELGFIAEELEQQGCPIETDDLSQLENLPVVAPVHHTWAELGVAVPERWKPWQGAYRYEDGQLTELEVPFGGADQVGFMQRRDDRLVVTTWRSSAEEATETRWTTSDGIDWTSEVVDYENEEAHYGDPFGHPIVAGETRFRVYWEEPTPEEYEAYEARSIAVDEAMSEGRDVVEIDGVEMPVEEAMALIDFEDRSFLQRSVAGGPWENVDLADLVPGLDVSDLQLQEARGTSYGVLVTTGRWSDRAGPPEQGGVVFYTNNGVDWSSFETTGNWLELHDAGDSVLAFDHRWVETENGGGRQISRALLLTPDA